MKTYAATTRLNDTFFGLTVGAFAIAVIVTSTVSLYQWNTTAATEYKGVVTTLHGTSDVSSRPSGMSSHQDD